MTTKTVFAACLWVKEPGAYFKTTERLASDFGNKMTDAELLAAGVRALPGFNFTNGTSFTADDIELADVVISN